MKCLNNLLQIYSANTIGLSLTAVYQGSQPYAHTFLKVVTSAGHYISGTLQFILYFNWNANISSLLHICVYNYVFIDITTCRLFGTKKVQVNCKIFVLVFQVCNSGKYDSACTIKESRKT